MSLLSQEISPKKIKTMERGIHKLIFFVLSVICGLFVIGVALDYTSNDWIVFGLGLITGISTFVYLISKRKRKHRHHHGHSHRKTQSLPAVEDESTSTPASPEKRPYKFIFTHNEKALDAIESAVKNHPKVEDAFQDSGFWYSNGETGPEWFSMHVRCKEEDAEAVQAFIEQELENRGYSHQHNNYMGSYN